MNTKKSAFINLVISHKIFWKKQPWITWFLQLLQINSYIQWMMIASSPTSKMLQFSQEKTYQYLLSTSVIGLSGGLFGMALNYLLTMADPFESMMRRSADLNTQVGILFRSIHMFLYMYFRNVLISREEIFSYVNFSFKLLIDSDCRWPLWKESCHTQD